MAQRANIEGNDSVTTEAEPDHHDPGRSRSTVEPSRFPPDDEGAMLRQHGNRQSPHNVAAVEYPNLLDFVHLDPFPKVMNLIELYFPGSKANFVIVYITMLLGQVFFVAMDSYKAFGRVSEHSKCFCDLFPTAVVASLRVLTRILFPTGIFVFYYKVMVGQPCLVRKKFLTEIIKPCYKTIASEFMKRFIDPHSNDEAGTAVYLIMIQKYLDNQLWWFCFIPLLQAALLIFALAVFPITDPSTTWIIGVPDLISYGLLLAFCSIFLSLMLLDGYIKQYFRIFQTFTDDKKLRQKAKAVDDSISDRWYPLNMFNCILCIVYCVLLLMSWSSGIPLSCGYSISKEAIKDKAAYSYWLVFMGALIVGQLMGANYYLYQFRLLGVVVEAAAFILLRLLSPTLEWSSFFHILYALYPLSYFLWDYISSLQQQWAGVSIKDQAIPNNHTIYWCRLFTQFALVSFIVLALTASLYTEYHHIRPSAIGKFSRSIISDEDALKFFEVNEYLREHCHTDPNSKSPKWPKNCYYLNPEMFEDDRTRVMIAKTISVVHMVWDFGIHDNYTYTAK